MPVQKDLQSGTVAKLHHVLNNFDQILSLYA